MNGITSLKKIIVLGRINVSPQILLLTHLDVGIADSFSFVKCFFASKSLRVDDFEKKLN